MVVDFHVFGLGGAGRILVVLGAVPGGLVVLWLGFRCGLVRGCIFVI